MHTQEGSIVNKFPYFVLFLVFSILFGSCNPASKDSPLRSESFLSEFDSIDLLIENGSIIDGLGNPAIQADVVIVGDRIVFVGESEFTDLDKKKRIVRVIDAQDRIVSPGFIDLHSHGDPLETPRFESHLAMGVTTIILGQDGASPEVPDLYVWMETVANKGIGPNIAMFVGHGTLRTQSKIGLVKNPSQKNLQAMLSKLDKSLDYTFGLSTGLEYNPGLNARADELIQLAKVVGKKNRMIMSHLRNEDDDQLEKSITELLDQGKHARVHIAHLKSVYGKGVKRGKEILKILKSAKKSGIQITADVYPYTASYARISLLFPVWAKTPEQFKIAKVERRKELEDYLRKRIFKRNGPKATLFGTDPYTGKNLDELSRELKRPFEEVLIDVIGPQGASAAYFIMNEELQSTILMDPSIGICTDGSPKGSHPRGHGTFAKLIEKYVIREGLIPLEEAIRKTTSMAAKIVGIKDRGILREKMYADLLIFDPAKVEETATYQTPIQLAKGFDIVIINGKVVREAEQSNNALPGQMLKP